MKWKHKHKFGKCAQQKTYLWAIVALLTLFLAACNSPVGATELVSTQIAPTQIPTHVASDPTPGSSTKLVPGDWPTYASDNGRSGFNTIETSINVTTAAKLKLHWIYHAK